MSERDEFEQNKVMLWGIEQANEKLLKEFDIGNKNPRSKAKVITKKPTKKEFDKDENYTWKDLPFLESEYDRISEKINKKDYDDDDEYDELTDLQDILDDLIANLKDLRDREEIKGTGHPKGSEEAKEWAKKMSEARANKKLGIVKEEKPKKETKIRIAKGSEEAKDWAKKMSEARKAKQKPKEEKEEKEEKIKKPKKETKKKPWYYIGDIPTGYREATQDEAIKNKKVSKFGKYKVDSIKYEYYNKYGILLSDDINDTSLAITINGLKKKIPKVYDEIEILENKIENPKHEKKHSEFNEKLKDEKQKVKDLNKAYNFYYKEYCKRHNIE